MKLFYGFIILFCGMLMAQGIVIEPAEMDFGVIIDSKMLEHNFIIKNNSDKVVHLEALPSSCGCMMASPHPDVVEPGQTSEFNVLFQPRGYKGLFRWEAKIATDLPTHPVLVLPLQAFILVDGVISSEIANFRIFKRGEERKIEIWMACREKQDFQIQSITCDVPGFNITYTEEKDVDFFYPGKQRGYKIEIAPKVDIAYGRNHGVIKICSDIPGRETIDVRLFATVIGDITAAPDYLTFGKLEPGKKYTKKLILSHNELKLFKVLGTSSELPFLSAKVIERIPNKYYYVEVTLDCPEDLKPGELRSEMYIDTDWETHKKVVVYIQGIVQAKPTFLKK